MSNEQPILVIGGTGKTGRRVAAKLAARGILVRIGARSGTPAFDWDDSKTWRPVLLGVQAMYLSYHPDLAAPGAVEKVRELAEIAVESGVRRIVLLSGRGEPQAVESEDAVRESGADLTVLRAAWFAQNFGEGHLLDSVLAGEIAFPGGTVAEPFIDVEDIADVAVAALLDEAHVGKTYDLTGPRLLTFDEAAREIAEASGRSVRYVPVSTADFVAAMSAHAPLDFATFLGQLFSELLDGHNAQLADGVESVLGRKARDFREFASDAAKAGAWAR